jgi:hypothetical protein
MRRAIAHASKDGQMSLKMLTMAACVVLAAAWFATAGARAGETALPARGKFLLLDSRVVTRTDNARLTVGNAVKHPANPLFKEDKPWEPRFDNLYANVIHDKQAGIYKCWYSPFIVDKAVSSTPRAKWSEVPYRPRGREMGVCYATSKDGLKWAKPELGLVEFGGTKANNLVVRGPHGAGVFKDAAEPDPTRRYKMFYKARSMAVRFSPDGLRWSREVLCPEMAARGDTHNNAFRLPGVGGYVGITRLWKGQRIVGRTESRDFVKWAKAVEVLRGTPEAQTYAMPTFRHAGVYLGLVMIFRPKPNRVHCELTWSADTVKWQRIDAGVPLIPLADKKGDYDWGCAYAAACPVVLKEEIRLYYGASNGTHNGWRDGFLALATLRPDGFAGHEPARADKPATVLTAPVTCSGAKLLVTADAEGGSVSVTALDEAGKPVGGGKVTGNVTAAAIVGLDLSKRRDKPVRLRFELHKAKLYAFSFHK